MTSSYHPGYDPPYEPDTPVQAEERLDRLSAALEANEKALKEAADAEIEAGEARDAAERKAVLSDAYPDMRAPGWNAARVKAWVEDKIAKEDADLRRATQARKAAEAQRRRLEGQLRAAQSINRNANDASYRAGGYR